ncbi:hypothetical protein BUN12_0444 [Bacillus amyloliquefaciens]|jgi:hypothetical protein|nr:hypothetical protein BAMTA208_11700 [Bacillus amyloliquefaciens TA208]AEB62804.1 hypothetical protein LL3_01262 [Bacillus amyloliquefaciens LL3]AEK89519.1 hypothetical protein BAXH7_02389 [Bacillus amyloliquefaciens XH7]AIW33145.1 hypothetical protein KS08_05640 [Bacillus subtilis]ARW38406.1 hypothetical protein S101267_01317 [Bacillus amyloliquefaciens]
MNQSSKPSQNSPYKSTEYQPYGKKIKKKGCGCGQKKKPK